MGLENLNSNCSKTKTKTFGCLICSKCVPRDTRKGKGKENASELFQVLCKYMKWEPPLKYCFNFDTDVFPFCKDCKASVVRLQDYNQLIVQVQKQIERTTSRLSAQILESESEKDKGLTVDFSQNSLDQSLTGNGGVGIYQKTQYYRNATKRRYSASVRLIVDPDLKNCQLEKEQKFQDEIISLGFQNEVTVEQIIPAEFNAAVDETYLIENVESNPRELEPDEEVVNEEFIMQEVEIENSKEISESEASTLKPLGQEEEALRTLCDDSEAAEIFMDESKNDDCDYSPDCSSDEDGEEIVQDHENKRKSATNSKRANADELTRYFGKCQYGDRVRFLGKEDANLKFLFDDSFPFELNSEGKWTCYTCRFSYREKRKLLFHLADTCKGPQRSRVGGANRKVEKTRVDEIPADMLVEKTYATVEDLPFNFLKDRVKKDGESFLLDDKCRFEYTKQRWRCISCDLTFSKTGRLRDHLHYCPGDASAEALVTYKYRGCIYDKLECGKYQCRHCRISRSSDDAIVDHLKECHVGKLNKVRNEYVEVEPNKYICNEKFPFEFVDENFKCGTCFANFSARSEVLLHIRRAHSIPGLKPKCFFTNPSDGKFMAGGFSFGKIGDEYSCDHCTYLCLNLQSMKDHLKRSHINLKKYACEACGKRFNRIDDLRKHEAVHRDDRPIICELCGKSFKLAASLRLHTARKHLEKTDKKFSCEVCGFTYGYMTLLRTHLKTHELVICHVCGKEVTNSQLPHHLETHDDNQCKVCGKRILHKRAMIIHMRNHEGIKPYSCDICNAKFVEKYNVIRHKARRHNPNKVIRKTVKSCKRKLKDILSECDDEELFVSGNESLH